MESSPTALLFATVPGAVGVPAVSRTPSFACGLPHQPGSWTPKPAPTSNGAPSDRNEWAPVESSSSALGRAERSASSSAG